MTAVPALSAAAVPTAAATGGGGTVGEGANAASFTEALHAEGAATAAPDGACSATATHRPAAPEAPIAAGLLPGGLPVPKPPPTAAAGASMGAASTAAAVLPTEPLPAALPAPGAAAATEASTSRESVPPVDMAVPALAAPEAFLQWLDTLRELSRAPLAGSPMQPAASESSALAGSGLQGSGGAAVTQQMIEMLAAGRVAESVPTGSAPVTPHAPLLLPTAAPAPASSSPPALTAAPQPLAMNQGDWPQQLGEQIQWRLGVGIQEARIEISPRELGAIDVRLSVDDRGLSVQLNAAQAQTRDMLQSELPRLREALQQGGLQLADAQVGREAPGRQGERQSAPARAATPGHSREEGEASVAPAGVWRARRGLLDDYA